MDAFKQAFKLDGEVLDHMGIEDQSNWNKIKASFKEGV